MSHKRRLALNTFIQAYWLLFRVHTKLRRSSLESVTAELQQFQPRRGNKRVTNHDMVTSVVTSLEAASRLLPVNVRCLERSIVGYIMLRRRGLDVSLFIGATWTPCFQAHAWVESGSRVIIEDTESLGAYHVLVKL